MKDSNYEILSVINDAVVTARSGRIVFANPPAQQLLGQDCVGKKLSAFLGVDIAGAQAADFVANTVINGRDYIVRASKSDGQQVIVMTSVRCESALISDAFLYSLRSSLMVLSMAAERCRRQTEDIDVKGLADSVTAISRSTAQMTRLVTNLGAVRNIADGNFRFSPRMLDLSETVRRFAEVAGSMLNGTKICTELPDRLICAADEELLELMLTNLVSNSVLHGGSSRISIRLIDGVESVILALDDDGSGISSEKLQNVFECYLSRGTISELNRGAGLGLTVVRGIAQLHGGTLLLESKKGRGTAVRVSLRKKCSGVVFRSGDRENDSTRKILIGLSTCLDEISFKTGYMD